MAFPLLLVASLAVAASPVHRKIITPKQGKAIQRSVHCSAKRLRGVRNSDFSHQAPEAINQTPAVNDPHTAFRHELLLVRFVPQ